MDKIIIKIIIKYNYNSTSGSHEEVSEGPETILG